MLAHRICQCTARTPQSHPISRVLCHQAALHKFLYPFNHTPSCYISYLRTTEQIQFAEPTLNWTPRSGSEEGKESAKDRELGIELLRREGRLRRHKTVDPVLNWISGSGPSNFPQGIEPRRIEPLDIEEPRLSWLPPSRNSLQPQLCWEQSIGKRTGGDLKKLLIDAAFERVRRRRSRLREPKRSLITRYLCFRKTPGLTRKVSSGHRNASASQELAEPSIKIGVAPVWGNRRYPRLRQYRLEFNPFANLETPRPETIQSFLGTGIEKPKPPPTSRGVSARRVASRKKDLSTLHAQRGRKSEARKKHQDAHTSTQAPTKTVDCGYRQLDLKHSEARTTEKFPITHTNTNTQQNTLRSRYKYRKPATRGPLIARNATLYRVVCVRPNSQPLQDRKYHNLQSIEKIPNTSFNIKPINHHKAREMGEPSDNSDKATEAMREAVSSDTNIEIPACNEGAASKLDLKRVFASPTRKTEWQPKKKQRVNKKQRKPLKEGGSEEILQHDVQTLLSSLNLTEKDIKAANERLPEPSSNTLELTITKLSSLGDGLAVYDNRVYVVPFTLPSDKVEVKIRHHDNMHTTAELVKVLVPSPDRDNSLIGCKYFGKCSGCQLQMLSYEKQLEHKRHVVQKAFASFSNLPAELLPEVLNTIGSPRQYQYRTKLTPHFNGPRSGFRPGNPTPNIGFMAKGSRYILDIEDCPIGTETVREGMRSQRAWVKENLHTYKRGATLLLRESTDRAPMNGAEEEAVEGKKYVETKKCVTDSNERSVEYFGDFRFDSPAGSFFQNNNSILTIFTDYIRENLHFPVVKQADDTSTTIETTPPKYLVDAYCGSGLFSISCGQGLEQVVGIDVDKKSIASARGNAELNNIKNATFIDGDAEAIFASIKFPGSETSLIIDPPRKGCDKAFLNQLLAFQPKRIVYVSCNVHSQARDIGYILREERGKKYKVDSIRGFDFFPQTHHVEGVAVLTRID